MMVKEIINGNVYVSACGSLVRAVSEPQECLTSASGFVVYVQELNSSITKPMGKDNLLIKEATMEEQKNYWQTLYYSKQKEINDIVNAPSHFEGSDFDWCGH